MTNGVRLGVGVQRCCDVQPPPQFGCWYEMDELARARRRWRIHYPSEDYPCLCERLVLDASGKVCLECEHDVRKHSARMAM